MKKTFIIMFCLLLLDQVIKIILINFLNIGNSIVVIKNFLNLTLVLNTGAAFSLFTSQSFLLIIISIIVLAILCTYIVKDKNIKIHEYIIYGVLMGGISGNLIDRIVHGAVIDYLDFNIFGYAFPIFNLADICIVISMFLIVIEIIKGDKNEVSSR